MSADELKAEELRAEIAALRTELENLRRQRDEELTRVFKEIALDRQRLTRLETPPDPTPSQKDRGEILRALLAANSGKMPAKEARQKMRLSESQFSQLLASMDGGIEQKPYHLDRRQKILILKSEWEFSLYKRLIDFRDRIVFALISKIQRDIAA